MKRLIFTAVAFVASLSAADLSGIYNGKGAEQNARYAGGVPYAMQMTLIQAGASLQGTITPGNNPPIKITSGSVFGNSVNVVAKSGATLATGQFTVNSNGQIIGTMTLSNGRVFTMAFTKQ